MSKKISWVKAWQKEGNRHKSKTSTPGERRRAKEEAEKKKSASS